MSDRFHESPATPATRWGMPVLATAVVAAAVISYGNSAERQAAAGSPYYGKAVQEAINGLKNPGAAAAVPDGRPALPAGLSPDDYYWCDVCKAYHRRDSVQGQAIAGTQAGTQSAEVIPPLPAGLSPNDYYWCVNCKAYHPRDKDHPASAAWAGVPYKLPITPVSHP